jgi:hypothetical protein
MACSDIIGNQAKVGVVMSPTPSLHSPPRDKRRLALISLLLFDNLDDFVPASEATENPDLTFGNAEMLCQ